MRVALLCAMVLAAALAFGGYFWVTKHERISRTEVQQQVGDRQNATAVRCVERTANGSIWWCAGLVKRAGTCWVIHVSVRGKVNIGDGANRCAQESTLAALMKSEVRIDRASLENGLARARNADKVRCVAAKRSTNKALWFCVAVLKGKALCWRVHVPKVGELTIVPGRQRCRTIPALRQTLRGA